MHSLFLVFKWLQTKYVQILVAVVLHIIVIGIVLLYNTKNPLKLRNIKQQQQIINFRIVEKPKTPNIQKVNNVPDRKALENKLPKESAAKNLKKNKNETNREPPPDKKGSSEKEALINKNTKRKTEIILDNNIKKKLSYQDLFPNFSEKAQIVNEIARDDHHIQSKSSKEIKVLTKLAQLKQELELNHLYLPEVLMKMYQTAKINGAIRKKNTEWIVNKIQGKNSYFRAYFYEFLNELITNQNLLKQLNEHKINSVSFTFVYNKKYSLDEEIGLNKQINIENDQIIYHFNLIEKPKGYDVIEGGVNFFALKDHIFEAISPTEFDLKPEINKLKSSQAFYSDIYIN